MREWGGYGAAIEEARAIKRDLEQREIVACPNDGTKLDKHPITGWLNCPMGDYRAPGGTSELRR